MELLKFGTNNAKLSDWPVATFSLPSGHTCPGALKCLAKFDRKTRKLVDGPQAEYRCYSASMEASRPGFRKSVDHNIRLLRQAGTEDQMADLIRMSLPPFYYSIIRIHVSGDFYNQAYFRAWCLAAGREPERLFYAYTKSLAVWRTNRDLIPANMRLIASRGGRHDWMIRKFGLRSERVVGHPLEARLLGIPIDHDDTLARDPDVPAFALLIHGVQPAGSETGRAMSIMKNEGVSYSYGRGKSKTEKQ